HVRRRALAFGGLWLLLTGMFAAAGLWVLLVASIALVLLGGIAIAASSLWHREGARAGMRGIASSIGHASRSLDARVGDLDLRERMQRSAGVASPRRRGLGQARLTDA